MSDLKLSKDKLIAFCICFLSFIGWLCLLNYKYIHLGYYDWDLAFFTQASWQLLHGSQFVSVAGINYFGDHSYFISLLSLPFFALAPHPLTLVVLKLAAFIIAAYLLYKIAYEKLGQNVALILMALYILFPANIFSILYEFNPESFAPPILFWMYMAFDKQRWRSFFVAAILLMLIKENMALIVCAFGIYAFLNKRYLNLIASIILLLGGVVFYVLAIKVIPHFRHLDHHAFVVRYAYLGHNLNQIVSNLISHPEITFVAIFNGMNAGYIAQLFGALLIPALFNAQLLFLVAPILLQHLLSSHLPEHTIFYHYGTTIAPFIFLATLGTLAYCQKKVRPMVFGGLICVIVLISMIDLYSYKDAFMMKLNYHRDDLSLIRWSFVEEIPANEGVIATFDYLAPLSLRNNLYAFHKVYDESYQNPESIKLSELNTSKAFVLPKDVHYALIDWQDPWLQYAFQSKPQETSSRVKAFFKDWTLVKRYGSISLFKR